MKLLIVSTAPLIDKDLVKFAYSPYLNELIIWDKYVDEIDFCCPIWESKKKLLVTPVPFEISKLYKVKDFNLNSFTNILISPIFVFQTIITLFKAMQKADHIHLRCPGNMGLIGSLVQILFPNKTKTAKYAGNWDPKSRQPFTYRLQKWILSTTFLTRNMQVLVYGQWEGSSKNIKPFFTATYYEVDKLPIVSKDLQQKIYFVFVGTLVSGKNPLFAIKIVEALHKNGHNVVLTLYGEGIERNRLEEYINKNNLESFISLKGNQTQDTLKKAYKKSHFVILPSESEGWPKAIAEGMFWGCVPVASQVSCVPFMLDYGKRGVLLNMNLEKDVSQIEALLQNETNYNNISVKASDWSRNYTLDVFEKEIKKMVQK
jgi:glycosyltransferase involved in cell wall biosynthesis